MYDDDSDLSGVNTANPLHDPNQGFLERGKVHERDQVIAQKNLLITSLLSAPGALPPGWLFQFTPQGDVYYIDPSGQSSWDHPIIGAIPTLPVTVAGNEGAQPATHGEEANTEDSVGGQEPRNLSIKSIKIEPGKGARMKLRKSSEKKSKGNKKNERQSEGMQVTSDEALGQL